MGTKVPDVKGQLLGLNSVGKWTIVLCSPSGQTQPMDSAAYFGSSAAWIHANSFERAV